eukprot:scaffold109098_cov87-Phaeocystis_antarctica.AAC.1
MHEASVTLSPSLLFYGDSGIAVGDTARRRTRCRAGFYRHYASTAQALRLGLSQCGAVLRLWRSAA